MLQDRLDENGLKWGQAWQQIIGKGGGGTESYPPLADRMDATLGNTPLPDLDPFWVLYGSVLVAILRRRNRSPMIRADTPKGLCERLVEEIRRTS